MEPLKHECGIAVIRLLKPISYYKEKYGSYSYGLNKLYLLMEKQHNRGQEGAGLGCIKLHAKPGNEYIYRERAEGSGAIQEIFGNVNKEISANSPYQNSYDTPYIGEVYLGHLRYSTTGKSGISYVHPFLRRNNWKARNLMLCGNFNMTNVQEIFDSIVSEGQHPRLYSDTIILLEQLGYALDRENKRLVDKYKPEYVKGKELEEVIEKHINWKNILQDSAGLWDGGFVICGASGSGDVFALRDSHGIRPAFYYHDDEICVITSERPVIQTVMNVDINNVHELEPGDAIIINREGNIKIEHILEPGKNERCSFERVYFSRGGDADIYKERKQLGVELAPRILKAVDYDINNTVFSFIPNTAEVAYLGMLQGMEKFLNVEKANIIARLDKSDPKYFETLTAILDQRIRNEKVAFKDIKLRTFIAEDGARNDLATHVYDVAYGILNKGQDNLVVIDDSIVRGTTLKQSIIMMLNRLNPRKIVIVSSSPQVRYPDYYGIDMSRMNEFCAFRAAIALLKEHKMQNVIDNAYHNCIEQEKTNPDKWKNYVKDIYDQFTDDEISRKIAEILTPSDITIPVEIIYQTLDGLHKSIPGCPGDWYFSGNYPTNGGMKMMNRAFINYYEGNISKRSS